MSRPTYFFDLGNTRGKFWRCQGEREDAYWAGPHMGRPESLLVSLPVDFDEPPAAVLGASVLDTETEHRFCAAVVARWGVMPEFARAEACFGAICNAYRGEPERLGVDRWLGIIGAAGDCDVLCVVGCGTAITIDIVAGTDHKGGYILPGLRLMQGALLSGTQKVRFDDELPYALVPGTSTAAGVRNAAMMAIVGLVEKVAKDEAVSRLVLTGGDAALIASLLQVSAEIDHRLLLKGMMRYFAHKNGSPMQGASQELRG